MSNLASGALALSIVTFISMAAPGSATARIHDQVEVNLISDPLVTRVPETSDINVEFRYEIFNSGSPYADTATLDKITEYLIPVPFTDTKYDVVEKGFTTQYLRGSCGDFVKVGPDFCDLQATFRIVDGDPTDSKDAVDDSGIWVVGISVPWSIRKGKIILSSGVATSAFRFIAVSDAPVPEPSIWALTTLGLGAVGAMLRRGRIGRACQSCRAAI